MQKSKREHLIVNEDNGFTQYHTVPGYFVKYYEGAKVMIDGSWEKIDKSIDYNNAFYNVKFRYGN